MLCNIPVHLHSNRSGTAFCFSFSQSLLIEVSALSSISKLGLSLAELGQVQSSNLFGLFNLLLVGFDLSLKLINESLHALVILPVLIRSISHLLDAPLRFTKVLVGISASTCLSINFRFQLADSSLHFVHGLLACPLPGIPKVCGLSRVQGQALAQPSTHQPNEQHQPWPFWLSPQKGEPHWPFHQDLH